MDNCFMVEIDFVRFVDVVWVQEQECVLVLVSFLFKVLNIWMILNMIWDFDLFDVWIIFGVIYQIVWNIMIDWFLIYGIKDYDVLYFDVQDWFYEVEDQVIC